MDAVIPWQRLLRAGDWPPRVATAGNSGDRGGVAIAVPAWEGRGSHGVGSRHPYRR